MLDWSSLLIQLLACHVTSHLLPALSSPFYYKVSLLPVSGAPPSQWGISSILQGALTHMCLGFLGLSPPFILRDQGYIHCIAWVPAPLVWEAIRVVAPRLGRQKQVGFCEFKVSQSTYEVPDPVSNTKQEINLLTSGLWDERIYLWLAVWIDEGPQEWKRERRDSIREMWYENNLTVHQCLNMEESIQTKRRKPPLIQKGRKINQSWEPQKETQTPWF